MIRITNNMMVNDLGRNLNTNLTNMDKYQRQLSTGRKINQPSDDPSGLVRSLRLRSNLTEGEQYLANIGEAINFMETTDGALNNIDQILQRVRELTVQGANGSNSTTDRQAIAIEIRELNDQLKMVANTTYGTKYVFAGRNVTEAPCQGDKWMGTDQSLQMEIGVSVSIPINLNNQDMHQFFTDGTHDLDDADNTGLFSMMNKLADDIESGDTTNINADLGTIDQKIDDLLYSRATIGARVNRLEMQESRLKETQTNFTALLSDNEDADMAEVIMNLKMQENVYRASLSAGARIVQPSLVDFLR